MRKGVSVLSAVSLGFAACGGSPELPPEDTMSVDLSDFDRAALVDPSRVDHWGAAALSVGVINLMVGVGLAPPIAVLKAAQAQDPVRDGDGWKWTFRHGAATATLRGREEASGTSWEMRIDGIVGLERFDDFVWYTGTHEAGRGQWIFHDQKGSELRLDWTRDDARHRTLSFEFTAGEHKGETLAYAIDGDDASVDWSFKDANKGRVAWSRATKAGSIKASKYEGHENEQACWDSTLHDAECTAP